MLDILRRHLDRQQTDRILAGNCWKVLNLIFPTRVGTPQSTTTLLKEFKSLLREASLPKIRFHDLHDTVASITLNRGVSALAVSKILGHSKPSTTLDISGHLIPNMNEGVAQMMDESLTPIAVDFGRKEALSGRTGAPEPI